MVSAFDIKNYAGYWVLIEYIIFIHIENYAACLKAYCFILKISSYELVQATFSYILLWT